MPDKTAIQQWVKYYLGHGFQHVYWYLHTSSLAIDVKGVTWFVFPWLKGTLLHYGGQLTAMQHCLMWNKESKTKWTLFADVDEYLVVTNLFRQRTINLIREIALLSPINDERLAGFDFGEYRIHDFMERLSGSNNDTITDRIVFDKNRVNRGVEISSRGRRKSLVRNERTRGVNIHHITPVNKSLLIHHFDPRKVALLHLQGLINYSKCQ